MVMIVHNPVILAVEEFSVTLALLQNFGILRLCQCRMDLPEPDSYFNKPHSMNNGAC